MNKILTIDPSGTGTSGICLISDKRIEFNSITVNTVKPFKDKLFSGQEQLEGLSCLAGRESKPSIRQKIQVLQAKKRLGACQKERLEQLEKFLAARNKTKKN
ncbi:23658_t:CDS:2 [Entrophospora sp. SA101]|nr:15093_t:CDS:2 [Entrophospora sp. SA101]CAJ0749008.1 23658_t:CDS:2 [Entrophospora sp. SA101]